MFVFNRCWVSIVVTLIVVFVETWSHDLLLAAETAGEQTSEVVRYQRDIRPIFRAKCQGCHQPAKTEGEYVMTSMDRLLAGGESGEPAILPGDPDGSYLVEMITPLDGEAEMPREGAPLSAAQVRLIRDWISQGAKDDSPERRSTYDRDHPPEYAQLPAITSLDFSPDGKLLAVPGFHEVALYAADGSQRIARLIGMSPRIESVRFSPDGQKLAVAGGTPAETGEVQIWDVESWQLLRSVPVTYDTVRGVSWSHDSKMLAFGCADNSVRAIQVDTGAPVFRQGSHNDWVLGTVFSRDASHIASVSRDMSAKLLEIPTQQLVDNITSVADGALKGGIHCIVRHPLRDEILFGGADGVPRIYKMFRTAKRQRDGDENQLWRLPPLPGRVFGIDISLDGRLIVAASSLNGRGAVHLYGMDAEPEIPPEIHAILNRPPGVRKPHEKDRLEEHFNQGVRIIARTDIPSSGIFAVAVDPAGGRVAAGGSDGVVRFIDTQSGNIIGQFAPFEVVSDSHVALANNSQQPPRANPIDSLTPETVPEPTEVVGLSISPESIHLRNRTDYTQVIVTAELNTGELVDATRLAQLTADSKRVTISSTGMVRPISDGAVDLFVSYRGQRTTVPIQVTGMTRPLHPEFVRDVAPIISRLGCNNGKCHGARFGQNGFKLSLRGYDPGFDVLSLTDDLSARRVNLASAAASLMLTKPTATVPHEGGQVMQPDSNYYEIIRAWIVDGARADPQPMRVTHVDVYPVNPVVERIGARQQLRVVAAYDDGLRRDVTNEAFIESGNAEVVKDIPGHPGLVEVLRRGEAPILVRFEGAYAATTLTVMGDRADFVWRSPPSNGPIDDLVWDKLKRTKTLPSPLCDDYEFVRRVFLDLTGLPPTADEVREFINAPGDATSRRDALIDRLVGSPSYVEFRTNKWADLLQVNGKFLGRAGATKFRAWIHNEIADNTPYDEFVRDILTADGSNKDNPAAAYYKILREPQKLMANTMHLFLATRFTCNECHDHPFERWTQDNFYQMSSWFAQVGFKKDEASGRKTIKTSATEPAYPLYEFIYDKHEGEVIHQRTQQIVAPAFPFECEHDAAPGGTRRQELASWIASPDNPYFAKSYANRIWGYFTGRGLIEPLDDIRAGNPPTNPELLQYLTRQFVASGFDTQYLIRIICQSRVYQLSTKTNRWNEDDTLNYSHAMARRLPAEVIYDSIYHTTGAKSEFPDVPRGTRAAALPDVGIKLLDDFLSNMGRPARESSCECERSEELQLGVVLALVNCPTVSDAIGDPDNEIAKLAVAATTDRQLVNEMFLRFLNRPGTDAEISAGLTVLGEIEDQHHRLSQRLAALEKEKVPIRTERENKRRAELEQAQAELALYRQQQTPRRNELVRQRQKRIAETETARQDYENNLPATLEKWEQANRDTTSWIALEPLELLADKKRTDLTPQSDQSVFVRGAQGTGAYRILARTNVRGITGVRIDALRDERLTGHGPGRHGDNFVLTELQVERAPADNQVAPGLANWEFAENPGTWTPMSNCALSVDKGRLTVKSNGAYPAMATQVSAPAGPFALEIVAKVNRQAMMRVYWSTLGRTDFDPARSHLHGVIAGKTPWRRYRFYFKTQQDLRGIRLDLDKKNGQMQVESIRLLRAAAGFQPVALERPLASSNQEGFDVGQAIDGIQSSDNGWSSERNAGLDQVAVFETNEVLGASDDSLIQVTLHQNFGDGEHALGKFRISVSNSPKPLSLGLPELIRQLLAIDEEKRTAKQQRNLEEYFRAHDEELRKIQQAIDASQAPLLADPIATRFEQRIQRLSKTLPVDQDVAQIRQQLQISQQQLANKRLTAAQDLAWALINNPEFLYNH